MGAVFSRFQPKAEDNYEKILSELDEKIRRAEIRLREIRIRERNALIILIVYSLIAYVTYVAGYWYFVYMSTEEEGWDLLKLAPVFTGPFLIVIGYKFETLWYRRKEANEQAQLEQLKAKQKLKIEELKKKTAYYITKNLLERYDSPKETHQPNLPLPQGQKGLVPRPVQPVNPNMRQPLSPNPQAILTSREVKGEKADMTPLSGNDASRPNNYSPNSITPVQRHWYDKLVDVLVGEDEQKYALICQNCFTWNGLAFPTEFEDVQYFCKKCNHFNPSRRSQRNGITSLDVLPSISSISNGTNNINSSNGDTFSMGNSGLNDITTPTPRRGRSTTPKPMSRNSSSDPEKSVEKDDYDDDGVAVSKRLASRSTSRRRRSSRSQNRLANRQGSDDDAKPYVLDNDNINDREE
ncbi:10788_t:CDS:1 [Acaulospora colombiana]|uniref:10788_t:CDS:1 n=1 Tax=Acaulospora colombiana TaxID=27376 RepID=A0ACA9LV06_9GLOM|nr:10788_t:CDS:1 [Acaulospora colombiana]